MLETSTKSKLLLINRNTDLNKIFYKNLIKEGYDVVNFFGDILPIYKPTLRDKLQIIFEKKLKRNPRFIHILEERFFSKYALQQIKKYNNSYFDYALIFRGDLVPIEVLEFAKNNSNFVAGFQLDGISVSKKILDRLDFFNRICVFDPGDVENYPDANFKFLPNCWFKDDEIFPESSYDLFYLGSEEFDRHVAIENLNAALPKDLNKLFILLQSKYKPLINHPNIKYTKIPFSYSENLELVKRSKILLDFKRPYHNGLSLRFFESLAYNKKVITNNESIRNYDFYHPNNIFVTNYENFDGLEEFLQKPYYSIPDNIRIKYRFDNWLKDLLKP